MRIAHIADVHLDRAFAGLSGSEGDRARERLRRTFVRCLELAKDRGADILTIGGDLWEEENVRVDTRRFVASELEKAGVRTIVVCGNHDPFLGGGSYERTSWPSNVTVVPTRAPDEIVVGYVRIWAASWTGEGLTADFLDDFRTSGEEAHVLLFHGTAATVDYFADQSVHCPFRPQAVRDAGFDICLTGHIHQASHRDGVVYPGSPEPLGWAETGEHCVALVDIDSQGVEVDLVPVNEDRYQRIEVDCTGCHSSSDVDGRLRDAMTHDDASHVHLRIELTGDVDRDCEIRPSAFEEALKADLAELRVIDATDVDYDLEHLETLDTVKGLFVRKMRTRIGEAADESERENLQIALTAGLRALDGRKDVVSVD